MERIWYAKAVEILFFYLIADLNFLCFFKSKLFYFYFMSVKLIQSFQMKSSIQSGQLLLYCIHILFVLSSLLNIFQYFREKTINKIKIQQNFFSPYYVIQDAISFDGRNRTRAY